MAVVLMYINSTTEFNSIANWSSVFLGILAVVLNFLVLATLVVHRKYLLKKVFYILVLHCSSVELLQSCALTIWCLPSLDIFSMKTVLRLTVVKRWSIIFLRAINILTVFNLLLFTLNEFILVKKPLLYKRLMRKRVVISFIGLSWILSIIIGTSSVLIRKYGSKVFAQSVFVHRNFSAFNATKFKRISPTDLIYRDSNLGEFNKYPFVFAAIFFSVFSLMAVFVCYSVIIEKIRRVKRRGSDLSMKDHQLQQKNKEVKETCLRRDSSEKRSKLELLLQHKYVLVIVSIMMVDFLFIIPYSIIQTFQYINISYSIDSNTLYQLAQTRWALQLLIGFHSVLLPFCYLRMKEFRQYAFCQK